MPCMGTEEMQGFGLPRLLHFRDTLSGERGPGEEDYSPSYRQDTELTLCDKLGGSSSVVVQYLT